MSGRSLRRLPILAHARYGADVRHSRWAKAGEINSANEMSSSPEADLESWLDAMEKVVDDQGIGRVRIQ